MTIDRGVTAEAASDGRARLVLVAVAASVGVAAALIFVGWPAIDLAVSRVFYLEPKHFAFTHAFLPGVLRGAFTLITWAVSIAAVAGIALALTKDRRLLDLSLAKWVFIAAVLVTGPGLIANSLLKDQWARPRPMQVTEFGGAARFTPVLERTGQCERNCSFISGESSSIFAIGFAAAMLVRRRRARAMAIAVAAGALIGLIRIGEGGHFLSDTIFAGVFMALNVALMHFVVFGVVAPRVPDETWWHERTWSLARKVRARSAETAAKIGEMMTKERDGGG